jgi:hypothetical protein
LESPTAKLIDQPPLPRSNTSHGSSLRLWVGTSLVIIIAATCLRLVLNLRHPLAPGMDAAYYPMQTRWLIEHGELMRDAPPLIFWLNTLLAKIIQYFTGMQLDDACMLSARLVDGLLHPWVALPIMMLGYRWARGRRDALIGCSAAVVLAVMSPPVMRMASDFQKNSVGLVWMAFAMWAVCEALAKRNSVLRWAIVAVLFLLAALTHIGAFGVTCVMLGGSMIGYSILTESMRPTQKQVGLLAAIIVNVSIVMLLIYWITPEWTRRLLDLPTRAMNMIDYRISPVSVGLSLAVYCVLAVLLRWIWMNRRSLDSFDSAVAIGCVAGLAVLMIPMLEGTWAMRFQLMTPIPGAILLTFCMSRLAVTQTARWQPKWLAVSASLLALAAPFFMQGPVITRAAADELTKLRDQIDKPAETLVVAPHGVEFWAGMMMHTQATSGSVPAQLDSYDRVLILMPKRNFAERHRRQTRNHGPGPRPRNSSPNAPPRRENEVTVPPNAQLIHSGEFFSVFEVI